jgi:hypothetical protein
MKLCKLHFGAQPLELAKRDKQEPNSERLEGRKDSSMGPEPNEEELGAKTLATNTVLH